MASLRPLSTAVHQTRTRTPTKCTFHWQQPVHKALWTKAANKNVFVVLNNALSLFIDHFVLHLPLSVSLQLGHNWHFFTGGHTPVDSNGPWRQWDHKDENLSKIQNYQITKRFILSSFLKTKAGKNETFIREWELVPLQFSRLCLLPRGKEAVWKTNDWKKKKSSMGPFSFLFENKARF